MHGFCRHISKGQSLAGRCNSHFRPRFVKFYSCWYSSYITWLSIYFLSLQLTISSTLVVWYYVRHFMCLNTNCLIFLPWELKFTQQLTLTMICRVVLYTPRYLSKVCKRPPGKILFFIFPSSKTSRKLGWSIRIEHFTMQKPQGLDSFRGACSFYLK